MNKKAQVIGREIVLSFVLILLVGIVLYATLSSSGVIPSFNPIETNSIISWIFDGIKSAVNWLKDIVVPDSVTNDSQSLIAFSVFLLILIIGTKSLNSIFNNWLYSFVLAFLVSLIAAQTLTPTIIKEYINVPQAAVAAAILGILPLMIFSGFIDSWGQAKVLTRWALWMLLGAIYWALYTAVFNMFGIGLTYFAVIVLASLIEVFGPFLRQARAHKNWETMGRFIGMSHKDLQTWQVARDAAIDDVQKGNKGAVIPKAPWEV